jgi:hypothetical protein
MGERTISATGPNGRFEVSFTDQEWIDHDMKPLIQKAIHMVRKAAGQEITKEPRQ